MYSPHTFDDYVAHHVLLIFVAILVETAFEVQIAKFLITETGVVTNVVSITTCFHFSCRKVFGVDFQTQRTASIRLWDVELVLGRCYI